MQLLNFERNQSNNCYIIKFDEYRCDKFIESGGFKSFYEKIEKEESREEEIKNYTLENLRQTNLRSWVAIGISFIALLFSIWQYFHNK